MQSDKTKKLRRQISSELKPDSVQKCDNVGKTQRESSPDVDDEIIFVPNNPKTWTEKHIETWVNWATKKFGLAPGIDVARIPKNAEDLAALNKAEFYIVCGSFEGGRKLSQHYKYMMDTANEKCDESLQSDADPG
jgi:hypothetical protein